MPDSPLPDSHEENTHFILGDQLKSWYGLRVESRLRQWKGYFYLHVPSKEQKIMGKNPASGENLLAFHFGPLQKTKRSHNLRNTSTCSIQLQDKLELLLGNYKKKQIT
jgi:hypothetical protein